MNKYIKYGSIILLCGLWFTGCNADNVEKVTTPPEKTKTVKFSGNYNKVFNDLHDLHIESAMKNGIKPMAVKGDTINLKDKLVKIPQDLPLYRTDKLTHSVAYLVPKASDLLTEISIGFRDSLISKKIPLHKLILTSLTRTDEDVKGLTKRNINASHNSAHCYGTTFDISWKRFERINPYDEKEVSTSKLKLILGQVLYDLQRSGRCYIKHEKKQACFHITVR